MLRRFVVENLGRLRRAVSPAGNDCGKLALIFAPNGYGKTTFTSALRAAEKGDAEIVRGRRSLGNGGLEPRISLEFEGGVVSFEDGQWTEDRPSLSIFDGTFVGENVHAAEAISLDTKRAMFGIVLGREGIELYEAEREAVAAATTAQRAEAAAKLALSNDLPSGLNEAAFSIYEAPADIGDAIRIAERRVAAVQQAATLRALPQPSKLPELREVPTLFPVLAEHVEGTSEQDAARMERHQQKFDFDKNGERWLQYGTTHTLEDDCPFCGRDDVDALGLLSLYKLMFSETYVAASRRVGDVADEIENAVGDACVQSIATVHAQNLARLVPWRAFCAIPDGALPAELDAGLQLALARAEARRWLGEKMAAPGRAVEADPRSYEGALQRARQAIAAYNEQIEHFQALFNERVAAAQEDNPDVARAAVVGLRKRQARSEPGVAARCEAYRVAAEGKREADARKEQVRGRLRAAVAGNTEAFQTRVNTYLRGFNASFQIENVAHTFPGGAGATGYGLRIRNHLVGANHNVAPGEPGFKNTLSTGDKTTLALAFFLARLDGEPDLEHRVVVFDDPFSSHDRFRQARTIDAIKRLIERCAQVIVLSHDEFFLREVHIAIGQRHARSVYELHLDGDSWAVVSAGNLDELNLLGQEQRIRDVRAFVEHNVGDEDKVALMLRQTLEHRYRNAFPALIGPTEMLGGICEKIGRAGPQHECASELVDLQLVNRETRGDHHGENREFAGEHRWDRENLRGLAADTLRLARAG